MPSVSDLARDLHDLAVPMIINHMFVHIVFVLLMGVKRGVGVGVNGVMEVAYGHFGRQCPRAQGLRLGW